MKFVVTPLDMARVEWADYRLKLIDRARNGDVDAASELVEIVATLLAQRASLPSDLSAYLSRALADIVIGKSADRAFNLVRRVGGQRTECTAPDRDTGVVALVELKMRELRRDPQRSRLADKELLPLAKKSAVQVITDARPKEVRRVFDMRRLEQILEAYDAGALDPIKTMQDTELEVLAEVAMEAFSKG